MKRKLKTKTVKNQLGHNRATTKGKSSSVVLAQLHSEQREPIRREMKEADIIKALDVMGITTQLKTEEQKSLFIEICKTFRLNPIKREIHAAEIRGKLVPVVGYDVYIDRAEESGRLEWWHVEETGEINLIKWRESTYIATLVLKRKDWPMAVKWSVPFREAVGLKDGSPNSMWTQRPTFMTKKCAIGQGFRLYLREVLAGMPYIDAELGESRDEEIIPKTLGTIEPQAKVGVSVSKEGVEQKQAAEPGKLGFEDPATKLKKARANLSAVYDKMCQVYDAAGRKLSNPDGTPMLATPKAGGPYTRLFSNEELDEFQGFGKKHGDDAESLENATLDWNVVLAERIADRTKK